MTIVAQAMWPLGLLFNLLFNVKFFDSESKIKLLKSIVNIMYINQ